MKLRNLGAMGCTLVPEVISTKSATVVIIGMAEEVLCEFSH